MSPKTQHSGTSVESWARHPLGRQLLMIANEMNRASKLLGSGDDERLRHGYERVLALADLTIETRPRPGVLREMLRWRDLVAALYIAPSDPVEHGRAFRALLQLHPDTWRQLPYVTGAASG